MTPLDRFDQLAAIARRERAPAIDVTARVMAGIRAPRPMAARSNENLAMLLAAGLAVLAASVMVAFTLDAWSPLWDPMCGLLQPLSWIMQ